MGYTHYFTRQEDKKVTDEQWDQIIRFAHKAFSLTSAKLCYECDKPYLPPIATPEVIRFNGPGELGHETFYLLPTEHSGFQFCKTAGKPYDDVVTAILLATDKFSPGAWRIASDGVNEEWEEGFQLFEKITGKPSTFSLD